MSPAFRRGLVRRRRRAVLAVLATTTTQPARAWASELSCESLARDNSRQADQDWQVDVLRRSCGHGRKCKCSARSRDQFPCGPVLRRRRARRRRGCVDRQRGRPGHRVRSVRTDEGLDPGWRRGHVVPGCVDLRGVHRHPRALRADRHHRCLRFAVDRLAQPLHVHRGAALRRQGSCRRRGTDLLRPAAGERHHLGDDLLRGVPGLGRRVLRGVAASRHPDDRRQGADGSQRTGRVARHRADRL